MWLKRLFTLISVILMLLASCSCSKGGGNLRIKMSPSDKSLVDLASERYDKTQLSEIVKFQGPMNEMNAKFPIECLRKKNSIYRVSYLGDGNIAVLLFDDSGNRVSGNIYSTPLLKSNFDNLKKGQLLDEVRVIDPGGEYLFLYTGRNDIPRMSSHYTKDGYLITIEYDASDKIRNIHEELI